MKSIHILIQPLYAICFLLLLSTIAKAQQPTVVVDSSLLDRINTLEQQANYTKPGDDHFMVVGLTTFGFVRNKTTTTFAGSSQVSKTNSLADADHYEFSPMFLWRHGNKFLLEFEPSFSNDQLGVNWAAISYFALPGLIIRGGYLVLPFGTYNKRLAAGWINKFASDPEGVAVLEKLYLLPGHHGRGLGRGMLARAIDEARALGARRLDLYVNKANAKAIRAYRAAGFAIAESLVKDIGGGFVMDDYRMTLALGI